MNPRSFVLLVLTSIIFGPGLAMADQPSDPCAAADVEMSEALYSQAIQSINLCLSSDVTDETYGCLLLKRARAYFEMGQEDKASGDVRSALRKAPDLSEPGGAARCLGISQEAAMGLLETADLN